jgi:hypothetical protein
VEQLKLAQKKVELEQAVYLRGSEKIREPCETKLPPQSKNLFNVDNDMCDDGGHTTEVEPQSECPEAHNTMHENYQSNYNYDQSFVQPRFLENQSERTPSIPTYHNGDDVEIYLKAFEKIAALYGWKKDSWMTRLRPNLAGSLLEIYTELETHHASSYEHFYRLVAEKYSLYAENYRQKFRRCVKLANESYREYAGRLVSFQKHWLSKPGVAETPEQLRETIAIE